MRDKVFLCPKTQSYEKSFWNLLKDRLLVQVYCLIKVMIEIYYVNNELISQKIRILSKNGGFPISFLKREHQAHACSNTIFNMICKISRQYFYYWIWRTYEEKLMKFSHFWENAGNGPYPWRNRSTRNNRCCKNVCN